MGTRTLDTTGLPDEAVEFIKGLVEENELLAKSLDEATAKLEESTVDDDDDESGDDVTKGLDPAAAAIVKSMEERFTAEIAKANAEAAKAIAKADEERAIRETAEWIGKAAEFDSIAADKAKLGKALREASNTLSPESFDTLLTVMAAANEAAREGSLFKEMGKSGGSSNDDSGASVLDKAARKLMAEDKSLSYPDALTKAIEQDKTLYKSYREGN